MNELQAWAVETIGAQLDTREDWRRSYQGPTVIPFKNMSGEYVGVPHNPALYGRYIPIDLDRNNRHMRDAYHDQFPDRPQWSFGFGVCRQGFGLQDFGDGYMDEQVATARAIALNRGGMATDVVNDSGEPPLIPEGDQLNRLGRLRALREEHHAPAAGSARAAEHEPATRADRGHTLALDEVSASPVEIADAIMAAIEFSDGGADE